MRATLGGQRTFFSGAPFIIIIIFLLPSSPSPKKREICRAPPLFLVKKKKQDCAIFSAGEKSSSLGAQFWVEFDYPTFTSRVGPKMGSVSRSMDAVVLGSGLNNV